MITNIKDGAAFLWRHRNKITFTAMVILIILFLRQCGQIEYERKKNYQNQKALTDTLTKVRQENGELIVQKSTFIASDEELKELNSELSKEVELLKKQKSKPKVVIKTKIVYVDRGVAKNNLVYYGDNKYSLDFNYKDSDSLIGIKGKTKFEAYPKVIQGDTNNFVLDIKPGETVFDTIKLNLGFTLGVKEDSDGTDRVFAKPSPYTDKIKIENVDAVQVEEFYKNKYSTKPKRFSVGPYIGVGAGTGNNGQIVIRPQIGVGLQWNLFKF